MIQLFDEAVLAAQNDIMARMPDDGYKYHERIVLRWKHVPPFTELYRSTIPKSVDAGKLLMVRGTVIRAMGVQMMEWEILYQCLTCQKLFVKCADLESFNHQPLPTSCGAPPTIGARAGGSKKCNGKKFIKVGSIESNTARDYQEIKLQEQVQHLDMGALPRSIPVVLMDDLVSLCSAGDDITVTGLVTRRWGELAFGVQPELELILIGSHLTINNDRKNSSQTSANKSDETSREFSQFWQENMDTPLLARDAILKSICPDVYGMYHVKLALAIVLAGGVAIKSPTTSTRGDPHLLMIGDPGTGKSQLLRFASKLATRSVFTTGVGTTSAGLTAAAKRDESGEWVLDAGALVLADGGACCIDEFGSVKAEEQTSLHVAMEQQVLAIAKAGIMCTLHTRCSVLAAANPKSKFNVEQSLSINTAIGGPLLSRFDLVLVLLDEPDEEWDKAVSNFILHERSKRKDVNELVHIEDDDDTPERMEVDNDQDALIAMFQNGDFDRFGDSSLHYNQDIQNAKSYARHSSTKEAERHVYSDFSALNQRGQAQFSDDMLNSAETGSLSLVGSQSIALEQNSVGFSRSNTTQSGSLLHDPWSLEKLQYYIRWVKSNFKPLLGPEAKLIGKTYYARQRQADSGDAARTTARLTESFVRITQGHAKLMARHVCLVQDAVFAIVLLESSTFTSAIGGQRFPTVRSLFPTDPDADYFKLERLVLTHLGLQSLISAPPGEFGGGLGSAPSTPAPGFGPGLGAADRQGSHARPFTGYNASQPTYLRDTSMPSMPIEQPNAPKISTAETRTAPAYHNQAILSSKALPVPQPQRKPSHGAPQENYNGDGSSYPRESPPHAAVRAETLPNIPFIMEDPSQSSQYPIPRQTATNTTSPVVYNRNVSVAPNDLLTPPHTHIQNILSTDVGLIPLPPGMDDDFGVWDMPGPFPNRMGFTPSNRPQTGSQ